MSRTRVFVDCPWDEECCPTPTWIYNDDPWFPPLYASRHAIGVRQLREGRKLQAQRVKGRYKEFKKRVREEHDADTAEEIFENRREAIWEQHFSLEELTDIRPTAENKQIDVVRRNPAAVERAVLAQAARQLGCDLPEEILAKIRPNKKIALAAQDETEVVKRIRELLYQ
jgi:hypothetical protein